MVYLDPAWIITDFLRNNLVDPRARAEATDTDNFVATAGQTTFNLTPPSGTVSAIQTVTVNAVTQIKWQDYRIDFENEDIIFFNGLTLSDAVAVTFKYGTTNWIYPDKPNEDLSETAFPRMNTFLVTGNGARLGNFEAPVESVMQFQIDVWTKEKKANQIFTINGNKYTGEKLANYLASQVQQAFEDNEEELHPALYDYKPTQTPARDLPFDNIYQAHHKAVEFVIKGLTVGRI